VNPYSVPAESVGDLATAMKLDPSATVVDVREAHEWVQGHVPGAVHIPMSGLVARVDELPRDRRIHVVCQVGGRSAQVVAWLNQQGYDSVNVEGGTAAWAMAGLPLEA
jgi:rhodanese-related sulfurtransferase